MSALIDELKLQVKFPKTKTLFELVPSNGKASKWDATSGKILADSAPLHYLPIEDLVFTEKVDGTCMGVGVFDDGDLVYAKERICDNPQGDWAYLEMAEEIKKRIKELNHPALRNAVLFGELCGPKIQKVGSHYFSDKRHFLPFDILNVRERKFFTWKAVKEFAEMLGLEAVPEVQYPYADLSVENVKRFILNQKSVYNPNLDAEGFVVRHPEDTAYDHRWMAKIRRKDFRS